MPDEIVPGSLVFQRSWGGSPRSAYPWVIYRGAPQKRASVLTLISLPLAHSLYTHSCAIRAWMRVPCLHGKGKRTAMWMSPSTIRYERRTARWVRVHELPCGSAGITQGCTEIAQVPSMMIPSVPTMRSELTSSLMTRMMTGMIARCEQWGQVMTMAARQDQSIPRGIMGQSILTRAPSSHHDDHYNQTHVCSYLSSRGLLRVFRFSF